MTFSLFRLEKQGVTPRFSQPTSFRRKTTDGVDWFRPSTRGQHSSSWLPTRKPQSSPRAPEAVKSPGSRCTSTGTLQSVTKKTLNMRRDTSTWHGTSATELVFGTNTRSVPGAPMSQAFPAPSDCTATARMKTRDRIRIWTARHVSDGLDLRFPTSPACSA